MKTILASSSKDELLQSINGGLDFYKHVIPDIEMNGIDRCKPTLCPFYDDTKPGFSIYFNYKSNRWQHKDHGSSPDGEEYAGDVFDFAARHYGLNVQRDFHQILSSIAKDLKIELPKSRQMISEIESWYDDLKFEYYGKTEDRQATLMGFELFYRGADDGIELAYDYFKQFGITKEILKEYNVRAIDWYKKLDRNDKIEYVNVWKSVLQFAYVDVHFAKFYHPGANFRFWYVGNKPQDYIFGYKQILRRLHKTKSCRETLIITGGEKDVLALTSIGYDAVCFNSETASIPKDIIENLFPIYKKIILLFDIDETGERRSKELTEELKGSFNAVSFALPTDLAEMGGKDISDYVSLGMDIEKLKNEIDSINSEVDARKSFGLSDEPFVSANGIEYETSPLLPESIYYNLPDSTKLICQQFKNPRDKDLVLLSALATISTFLPKVRGIYGGKSVWCNLFLFVTAPASSGKGVMTWSKALGNGIQQHLGQRYKKELQRYFAEIKEYEDSGKRDPDATKPEEPKQQQMFIPANSSSSMMIEILDANQDFGLIFETEGDTLANVLNKEWGDFSDNLRCAFHHEPITMARRDKKENLEVPKPKLSVVLSGTENQVNNLIRDVENGFFSRMLFYTFRSKIKWEDQFTTYGNELENIFNKAAITMLEYWKLQDSCKPCTVLIQKHHAAEINRYFSEKLQEFVAIHGEAIVASVKRFCLIFYRLAMVLTSVRCLDTNKSLPEKVEINKLDYTTAFAIVDTLMGHLQIVYRRLENSFLTSKLNGKQKLLYNALPDEFSRRDYDGIAERLTIKYKTAERYLGIYIKRELLLRAEHGEYQKI